MSGDFYIGYQKKAPAEIASFVRQTVVGVVLLSGRVKRELDAYLGRLRAGDLQRY